MKTRAENLFLLPALIASVGLALAGRVTAQTFTTLYSFTATSSGTNSDGQSPNGSLILSGNILYGTAAYGGGSNWGTVFALKRDGTGLVHITPAFGADDY